MESHVIWCSLIHDPLTHRLQMRFMLCCECVIINLFVVVRMISLHVLCLTTKTRNMAWFSTIVACLDVFAPRWIVRFALTQHQCGITTFMFPFLHFQHCVNQTCHHVFHSKLFHWHLLQCNDQLRVRGWQNLEQNHNNIFHSHGYLQASELTRNYFHLVDVVQQIITFLRLTREELVTNEENVGQAPYLMDVAKDFSCLRKSFVTFNLC